MSLPSLLYTSQKTSNQWKSSTGKHTTDIFLLHCKGVKTMKPTDSEIEPPWCKQRPHKSTTIWELSYFWALLFESQKRCVFTPETVATPRGAFSTRSNAWNTNQGPGPGPQLQSVRTLSLQVWHLAPWALKKIRVSRIWLKLYIMVEWIKINHTLKYDYDHNIKS